MGILIAAARGDMVLRHIEADQLAEQNYRNHPEYLFAKLDYARMLLPDHPATEMCGEMIGQAQLLQGLKKLSSKMLGRGLLV